MVRPCFLVIDREYSGSISTRKLVLETAKYNVITAYSGSEAIDTLKRFPALDAAVMDASPRDMSCGQLVAGMRNVKADLPIITVGPRGTCDCGSSVTSIESFDPARLLETVKKLDPVIAAKIEAHNEELAADPF